ncbi:MAG: 5-methyltetrahydropteroyltriglutamate--homocysteine S-methyltransferase [Proteobacteria bacterium]|nr:MAG: 5-methyltetrahydropteroyltriglutamate--homocysteine S-methyltransferase [Pseudomonadota bacterium]
MSQPDTFAGASTGGHRTSERTFPFRAEHVGSFLRPPALLEARARFQRGEIDAAQLRAAEDEAIRDVVAMQERVGLETITDGEFRREYFHLDFLGQLGGVHTDSPGTVIGADGKEHLVPPTIRVVDKVHHARDIQRRDFEFLKGCTTRTPKVTIPSPTMLHFRAGRAGIDRERYPDLEAFYQDVADAYVAELHSLAEAGCTYVQLDDTNMAYLCDARMREAARERGDDPDALPFLYAHKFINPVAERKPPGMILGMHVCRGNFKSTWAAQGGYEPVAEALLSEMKLDAYFLEYDDERSGDFGPLRHLPKGDKVVVLGLLTTKSGDLEEKDRIKRRIEEATRHVPLEQLALSPQCGFASTVHGNELDFAQQSRKLELVVDIARDIWGDS